MLTIQKIVLHNFKRFSDLEIDVNPQLNIFIGDNESGKSSILQAIDLVARGSHTRVGNIGLDKLFNTQAIATFMAGDKSLENLPKMYVELYFADQFDNPTLEGQNNSKHKMCSGIRMRCLFDSTYGQILKQLYTDNPNIPFPFEFYKVVFETFSGQSFIAYTKKLYSLFIDNSQLGNKLTMLDYVNTIYRSCLHETDRLRIKLAYRDGKKDFQDSVLSKYNAGIAPKQFAVKDGVENNIETDITIIEDGIPLENKGAGIQCFAKTQLSLNRYVSTIDVVLIEEPETHLSYMKTQELVKLIQGTQNKQLFISTHNNLIATRLNLQNCFLLNSTSANVVTLSHLTDDTAKFFIKAPDHNMLQFILSKKVILVEGDAEFILMDAFCHKTLGRDLESSGIGVIAVDGKCFKRYLEIACLLGNKVAVITDNDRNYQEHIIYNYSDYISKQYDNLRIFADNDDDRYTFEVCVYNDNQDICEKEFSSHRRRVGIVDYMKNNKSEVAYKLLCNQTDQIVVPSYIQEALKWIDA